ncbi:MAG: DUF3416 domain-containing protein [Actinomycetaceae bacterium]|nr:DUF3416 domain-containing protein [Actinomycetaceae bacterium]
MTTSKKTQNAKARPAATAASKTSTTKKAPAKRTAARKSAASKTANVKAPAPSGYELIAPQRAPYASIGRIPIIDVSPQIQGGAWPAKATKGESFPVQATVFREGHSKFAAECVLVDAKGKEIQVAPMKDVHPGLFRYEGWLTPPDTGEYEFFVRAWSDPYATWLHGAKIKVEAGIDIPLVFLEAEVLFKRIIAGTPLRSDERKTLRAAILEFSKKRPPAEQRLAAATSDDVMAALKKYPLRDGVTESARYKVYADRELALYSSWYEFFPRTIGAYKDEETGEWVSGTLKTAADDLDRVAGMGFNVIYLTPIHPIGTTNRKGKNNTLTAEPGDPGSPYAIGSHEGGHDAIHPDLGTFDDFDAFVAKARSLDMEVALDIALQASPDHPWVTTHPEFFTTRADGTIAFAENPPKKYQDIYPLNFDNDPEGIYQELKRIFQKWIDHGVTLFRIDNPHTKNLCFWQRILEHFRKKHPEVIFLSEAFTNPPMMQTLGALGYHQSYTYFAWRNEKKEIEDYLWEVSRESDHRIRPSFWPTTHDILTPYMQRGGTPAFAIRAVLAATGSPSWGIYSGYELVENVARPGAEEQIDNEKYEYKSRDFKAAEHNGIARLLGMLNDIRAKHPALQRLRNVTINPTTNDKILCFTKVARPEETPDGKGDAVIVVLNLDPYASRDAQIDLNLDPFGAKATWDGRPVIEVTDEMSGETYLWNDRPYVRLDPHGQVAHILSVKVLNQ